MKFRSALHRARGLGSSQEGHGHWWLQRVTSLALIPLALWFVYSVIVLTRAEYSYALAWLGRPLNASLMLLFVTTAIFHGELGVQVVLEDYVPNLSLRRVLVIAVKFTAALLAVLSVVYVLKVAMGSV
ncbi:MAG TPA: succinate dehydrogenase, hydrophobic membrane anchor protein [Gammaproteobacteria bacterium]|nr:succinate dehydrogenase, hydrophobic membrane anchor protein [Gammaproteobacteria bacterium]